MDKKEQTRLRVERYRNKQKSVTQDKDVTQSDVTQETVPASYVEGLNGKMYQALPERARFLTLSDGQVLDRSIIVPGHASGDFIQRMRACNEAEYNYQPNVSSKAMVKELLKAMKG